MTVSAATGSWPVEVGIVRDLPVAVLLGRDWPGFEALLTAATQPASPRGGRRGRKSTRKSRRRPVLLASDSGRDGESPSHSNNLFFDVYQQVSGGGSFGRAQREDERLKHCWSQVCVMEKKDLRPKPHPLPHFVVENGLLYCVAQRRGEEKRLLVVPRSKTEMVIQLAHAHPLAGHLGAANTTQRIRDRFHWPGLEAGLPEDVPQASSSYTAHSAAHHRGALRAHRDGSGGAVTKVSPGTRTHPCHRGLCHPVPRSHTSTKSHRKEHRSGAIYAFQPGGHTSGDLDRSGNPVHVPTNGGPLPVAPGKATADDRIPSSDGRARRAV